MPVSPNLLLGYVPLMESVELTRAGIPKVFPQAFWDLKENVLGDKARYIEFRNSRRAARILPYGAPPRAVEKLGPQVRDLKLLHSIEETNYGQEMLQALQQWGAYAPQDKFFKDQLTYFGQQFAIRQENLRIGTVTQTLANGAMYFDASGNLLPTAAGAELIVDQGVDPGNKGSCGGVVTVPWSDPTADISQQILNLQTRSLQTTGRRLEHAFYGRNVFGFIARNASVKSYLGFNPQFQNAFAYENRLADGFMGLKWTPAQDAFYEDSNGAVQQLFPDEQVTFTPAPAKDWWTLFEGSYLIPKSFGFFADSDAALANMEMVYGMFRFAFLKMPPTTIFEHQGDTFMPRIKVPNAVFLMDTTP